MRLVVIVLGLAACGSSSAPPSRRAPAQRSDPLANLANDPAPSPARSDGRSRGHIQVRITASGGLDPYALEHAIAAREADVIACFDDAGVGDEGYDLAAIWQRPGAATITGTDDDRLDACLGRLLSRVHVIVDPVAPEPPSWPLTVDLEIDRSGAP